MPNAQIEFPSNMNLEAVLQFARELDYYSQHDRLIINLRPQIFFPPFAMLLFASKIRYMREKSPGLDVVFNGWENLPYLSHVGFYDMCGYIHGKSMGEAVGNQNYIPITNLNKSSLYEVPTDKYEEIPDLIQRAADRSAAVLCRDMHQNKHMFDALSYSIREIFRNVFEHSESENLYFCAQYWPKSRKVEFAVSDFGIGIRRGLGLNPNFRFKTDKQAIEYSLLPSVSGKTHLPRRSEVWFNSGYGLYMTNRLARNGGNFVIASGNFAIGLSRKTKVNYNTSFPGTIIRVNLSVDEIGDVEKRLIEFRQDGHLLAAQIQGTGNRPPSAMSLLLRRDYQRKI